MNYVYTIYHNQGSERFWKAGTDKDPYKVGYTGIIENAHVAFAQDVAQDREVLPALFELVFVTHNRDDRPDRETDPALSVGDVVAITRYDAAEPLKTEWRTVDSVGFKPVGIPTNLIEEE